MESKQKKVLYFVDGFAPSRAELQAASQINAPVEFRNVQIIDASTPLEKCDGVAGKVPSAYAEAFPVLDAPAKKSKAPTAAESE